jgi:hypothetical protein
MGYKISRIGLMFHETFKLNRSPINEIITLANHFENSNQKSLSPKDIKENTLLGNNYIKAFLPYSKGVGLLNFETNLFTKFGKKAIDFDPSLSDGRTMWLMHYHMSSPGGPGPEFWSDLVRKFFIPRNHFDKSEIRDQIAMFYWEKNGQILSSRSVNSTASIFLSSYLDNDGLGHLNILEEIAEENYLVRQPNFHYPMVLAFALCHFWENEYPGNVSVTLGRLLESDLPKLFLLSKEDFEVRLDELKAKGFLDIFRTAQPYQIFLKLGSDYALGKIYGPE